MSRVALIGENSVEYVNALLDIWNNGDAAVLIDWRIPISSAIEMMNEAGVTECHIENNIYEKYSSLKAENIVFKIFQRESNIPLLLPKTIHNKFQINYSKDEAVILYSSGTTGKSKGIILSHYAINTNADAIMNYMNLTEKDCMYIVKSLCHSSTLTGELLIALKFNIPIVISPTIVPPRKILDNIQKFNVTTLCINPTLLQLLSEEQSKKNFAVDTLHTIYVSGSILYDNTRNIADKVFSNIDIYNVYGLSEAGPRVTAQRANCCKGNSVGKAINGVEIAIVNEEGEILPELVRGTVHVKTPSLFSGYICGSAKQNALYKDWLNTGDIGFIDKNGELFIVDRVDDIIIIGSRKVYPSEIEDDILTIEDILECMVLKHTLESGTDAIACYYVASSQRDFSKEIKKLLLSKRCSHEIPTIYYRVNSIKKNNNGKKIRLD